jgi:hypothetical protein
LTLKELRFIMKKTEEKKALLIKAYEDKLIPFGEVCKELGISRQSAYTWLADEGIRATKGHTSCRSKTGRYAREHGISIPTARKYIAAQERAEKEGVIGEQGLRDLGIGGKQRKEVAKVLSKLGLSFEGMTLSYKDAKMKLNVEQTIELFKKPTETLRRILK